MRTSLDCLSCLVRQAVESIKLVCKDEPFILEAMKKVFFRLSELDLSKTPPEIAGEIHTVVRDLIQNKDPFLGLKRMSTQRALSLVEKASLDIASASNPIACAVAFSIAGNILDFGMKSEWDETKISHSFKLAKEYSFDSDVLQQLIHEIESAKSILVLGDNAGEAVFDRLLIEQFPKGKQIYYAVKESPIINDVTVLEAVESGIDQVAEIISNGANYPGTVLNRCSEPFLKTFYGADLVLSKGQGNFETLNESTRKVWFLFQVKCPVISRQYHYPLGQWMILEKK